MKLAIELLGIWTAANIAFALQLIYLAQRRERQQLSFAGEPHPRSETVETAATPPGFGGTVSTDNFKRSA